MSNGVYDYRFKVAFIGSAGVGKTSLMTRFTQGVFNESISSNLRLDRATKILVLDDCRIQLEVWDTAGQERFRTITQSYYRNANGLLLTYDMTNYESMDVLRDWIEDVKRYAAPDVLMMLVGTKKDLEREKREVTEEFARKFASNYPNVVDVIETSAKRGTNIEQVFENLALALKSQREVRNRSASTRSNSLEPNDHSSMNLTRLCKRLPCCS